MTLLRSRNISMTTTAELVNFSGEVVEDVSDRLIATGSHIERDATARVDGGATLVFDGIDGFDFGRHLLDLSVTIQDNRGEFPEQGWRLGRYVLQPPRRMLANPDRVTLECYDVVGLLDSRLDGDISLTPGTNVATGIIQVLIRHGVVGLDGVVDEQGAPLQIGYELASYANWHYFDDVSYLDITNELLEAVAYVGLYADREGVLASYPWTPLERLPDTWSFDSTRRDSYITAGTLVEPPVEQVPNVWIAVCTPSDAAEVCEPVRFTLDKDTLSPYSVSAQGGRRNTRILKIGVATTRQLQDALAEIVAEDLSRVERVRIECKAPLPNLWQSEPVSVHIPELDIVGRRGIVREWRLPLDIGAEPAVYWVDLAPEGYES